MTAGNEPLAIAHEAVALGTTRDLQLTFGESYLGNPVSIPVRVMRAAEPGPIVFLTGAVHGDELTGIGIIRELLYNHTPVLERGTVVFVPVVNIYGLESHVRYLPDRRDLNRCFPGIPDGSLSSRLAHALYTHVIRHCHYGIDFHSAAVRATNYPNVRGNMRDPGVQHLAEAFGCELIVHSRGPAGSLRRVAVDAGIPTIVLEAGEVWRIEPEILRTGVRGSLNVFKALGMLSGSIEKPPYQVTIRKTQWVRAGQGGILSFLAQPGALVRAGQELATCHSVFGRERHPLVSPVDGVVLGMSTMPAVKPGEPVYHLATLKEKDFQRAEAVQDSRTFLTL